MNLSSDSEIEESANPFCMSSLSKPSDGCQKGDLWCNNQGNIPISCDNLLSRAKLFRSKLVTKCGHSPLFATQQPENVVHFTWQEDIEQMQQAEFENTTCIYDMFWER